MKAKNIDFLSLQRNLIYRFIIILRFIRRQIPEGTEVLAGLEMGGIPIATALSLKTEIPVVFVRKKAKEYGTYKLSEGTDIKINKYAL